MTVGAAGPGVSEEIVSLAAINAPGAAELILAGAGFEEISFGTTQAILEFGDDEIAWRALRSPGLVLPRSGTLGSRSSGGKCSRPFHPTGTTTAPTGW